MDRAAAGSSREPGERRPREAGPRVACSGPTPNVEHATGRPGPLSITIPSDFAVALTLLRNRAGLSMAEGTTVGSPRTAPTGLPGLAAFSGAGTVAPDGSVVAAGDDDGTVRLPDIGDPARPHLLTTLSAPSTGDTAGTPIMRAEWHRYIPSEPYDPPCR
jgi:hypothetical protein